MRITIEVPDDMTRLSSLSSPSVTYQSSGAGETTPGDALSGGEASPAVGGVAAAFLDDASSAGAAEQDSPLGATGTGDDVNDGGSAPG